jgi:FAD dependent oxidoreductase
MKALLCMAAAAASLAAAQYDVVVYGGTAGGVMAAYSAAREGLKVALLEPTRHIGGMVSGGLGWTDTGKKEVIGGYALDFYRRAGRHYEMSRYGQEIAWTHEPHVAEEIFRQMLAEAKVTVLEAHRLRESKGVKKSGTAIAEIYMENGASFTAAIFIDSSYEGDLMAQAGVSYTVGRESMAQYGESLAGVRGETPKHQFTVNIPARDENGHLLPEIFAQSPGPPGSADKKVQAYNFRLCFSDDPQNQVGFYQPEGYDPHRYELLARLLKARTEAEGAAPRLDTLMKPDRIENHKADVNNNGAFSTDYLGGSWDYPDASYQRRAEIWQAHKDYMAGLLYFLARDPRVPDATQKELNNWGLCRDEFTDNDHWPYQLYIREARRMVGDFVMTQKDLQTELAKPDPIGMGSYNSDSHNVERIANAEGFVRNEGDVQVPVEPYQIPYRIMLPKRGEAANLLVPVAFSASHVAYSSVRMEPQYMILGQAAGVAAKLAIAGGRPVQDVDPAALTERLRKQGAVMEFRGAGPRF